MMIVTTSRKATRPEYEVRHEPCRHGKGMPAKSWHCYAGNIKVGGCFKSKREAQEELRSFRQSEYRALGDI